MWIHAFTTVNKCSCLCGYGTSRCPEIGRCDIKHDWNLQVVGTIVLIQTSVSVACLYLCCYGVVLNFVKARVSIQSALQLHIPDNGLAVKKYWHQGGKHISMLCKERHYVSLCVDTGKTTLSDQSLYCLVSSFAKRLVGPWLSGLQNSTMKCRSSDQSVEGSLWPQDSEWFEISEILPMSKDARQIVSNRVGS